MKFKFVEIEELLNEKTVDVLFISETKIENHMLVQFLHRDLFFSYLLKLGFETIIYVIGRVYLVKC
jgi:hypothetical protein